MSAQTPGHRNSRPLMAATAIALAMGVLESVTPIGLVWPVTHLLMGAFWLAAFASTYWLVQHQKLNQTWLRPIRLLLVLGLWMVVIGVTLGWLLRGDESPPVRGPDGAEFVVRRVGLAWPTDVVVERRRLFWPLQHERVRGSFERERVLALQPGPNAELRVVVDEFGKPPRTVDLRLH